MNMIEDSKFSIMLLTVKKIVISVIEVMTVMVGYCFLSDVCIGVFWVLGCCRLQRGYVDLGLHRLSELLNHGLVLSCDMLLIVRVISVVRILPINIANDTSFCSSLRGASSGMIYGYKKKYKN